MKNINPIVALTGIFVFFTLSISSQSIDEYCKVIKEQGENPYMFVENKLKMYDLIVFDDALHAAVEPFEFYMTYH